MSKKLYVAYGSNMNIGQMAKRCPTAELVGSALLEGYKLVFRGEKDNAHATVEPCDGGVVPIVVWEITPADEKALDRYEGFPVYYRKETVALSYHGITTEGMMYVMNVYEGTENYRPLGSTNPWYYATIREGYKSAGFDLRILEHAALKSVEPGSDIWGKA